MIFFVCDEYDEIIRKCRSAMVYHFPFMLIHNYLFKIQNCETDRNRTHPHPVCVCVGVGGVSRRGAPNDLCLRALRSDPTPCLAGGGCVRTGEKNVTPQIAGPLSMGGGDNDSQGDPSGKSFTERLAREWSSSCVSDFRCVQPVPFLLRW